MTLTVNTELVLRNYTDEDAGELFAAVQENRAHLRPWLMWVDSTQRVEHSLEYIRVARQAQYDQQSISFGVFRNGRLVGGLSMHHWERELKKAQIGYWLAQAEQGRGTMHYCVDTLLEYLFGQLQLNKVELHYLQTNLRSAGVARKLGFKVEGILRDSSIIHGALQDLVVSGLLKREWQKK